MSLANMHAQIKPLSFTPKMITEERFVVLESETGYEISISIILPTDRYHVTGISVPMLGLWSQEIV